MNAITPRTASTAVASLMTLKQGLANVANTIPASGGDPYLRMLTDGQWVFGADDIEVADNDVWAVNIFSVLHGYVCWTQYPKDERTGKQIKKNDKLGEVLVPSSEPKPLKSSLHDHSPWEWSDAVSFQLKGKEGENAGEQVLYNVSSKGGLGAAQKLLDAITKQLDDDIEHPVPLVKLLSDHYPHSTYGRTYFPIFEIVGWATLDGAAEAAAPAPEPEPAKPTRTRKASVPEVKPEPTKQPEHETVAQAAETPMQKMRRELAEMEAEEARLLAVETAKLLEAEKSKIETPPAQSAGEPEIRRRRRSA